MSKTYTEKLDKICKLANKTDKAFVLVVPVNKETRSLVRSVKDIFYSFYHGKEYKLIRGVEDAPNVIKKIIKEITEYPKETTFYEINYDKLTNKGGSNAKNKKKASTEKTKKGSRKKTSEKKATKRS